MSSIFTHTYYQSQSSNAQNLHVESLLWPIREYVSMHKLCCQFLSAVLSLVHIQKSKTKVRRLYEW